VREHELSFELIQVQELGGFRLETIEFPDHYLVRVPAAGMGRAYRGGIFVAALEGVLSGRVLGEVRDPSRSSDEFPGLRSNSSRPLHENWRRERRNSRPRTPTGHPPISRVFTATIADNIPYWKLKTQLLGGEGTATDFAMWLASITTASRRRCSLY